MSSKRGFVVFVLEFKIILRVVIADVFNHPVKHFLVVRYETLFHVVALQIAQQAAEILMTRI